MDRLEKKTFKVTRDLTYTYYYRALENSKPTLVMTHGFPDSAHIWQDVVVHFLKLPYGLLIPDLLGYGGTSKPTDPALYNSRDMAKDIYDVLAYENISTIIPIGHDWGSYFASRIYLFRHLSPKPLAFPGLVLLNVSYIPPSLGHPRDLKKANEHFTQKYGYPILAYQQFFIEDPNAVQLLNNNIESFYTAVHNAGENAMVNLWCTPGGMKKYLQESRQDPIHPHAEPPRWRDHWLASFKKGGFEAPLCWYKAYSPHHEEAGRELMGDKWKQVLDLPVFYLECKRDVVCRIDGMYVAEEEGYVKDWSFKSIDCGHWGAMERPDEVAEALAGWLEEKEF